MAVSKRLRFEILRRDNFQCRYCGAKPPQAQLRIDHVIPEALGGQTVPENLVTSCEPCNSGKTSTLPDSPLVEDVRRDALRWARALEAAAEIRRLDREAREAYVNYFTELWNVWKTGRGQYEKPIPLDPGWQSTIEKFYAYHFDPDELKYAVRRAMENDKVPADSTYRYFCGICWNILREMRETAADIVMAEVDDEFTQEG